MSRRMMFRIFASFSLFCLIAFVSYWCYPSQGTRSKPMPTDIVVKDYGRFVSSECRYSLEIVPEPAGSTSISVMRNGEGGALATDAYPVFETGAHRNEDWFVAMDRYLRFWIYVGPSTDGLGRQTPSVYVHGATFDESGNLKTSTCEVSRTGDWVGVPQAFLACLQASNFQWVEHLPTTSPAFTAQRQSKLEAARR